MQPDGLFLFPPFSHQRARIIARMDSTSPVLSLRTQDKEPVGRGKRFLSQVARVAHGHLGKRLKIRTEGAEL